MSKTSDCAKISKQLADFAEGYLSAGRRESVRLHLQHCVNCSAELAALERTREMLNSTAIEQAPDRWEAILPSLAPRRSSSSARAWFSRYRIESTAGAVVAAAALAAVLLIGPQQQPTDLEAQSLMLNHASMSWREPFADRAALGLAGVTPIEIDTEDSR